jgi:hypothetical protein
MMLSSSVQFGQEQSAGRAARFAGADAGSEHRVKHGNDGGDTGYPGPSAAAPPSQQVTAQDVMAKAREIYGQKWREFSAPETEHAANIGQVLGGLSQFAMALTHFKPVPQTISGRLLGY